MNDEAGRALRPLWLLATGVAAGAALANLVAMPGPAVARIGLLALGLGALTRSLLHPRSSHGSIWLLCGLALAASHGLELRARQLDRERSLTQVSDAVVRIRARVREGWQPSRWGLVTSVAVVSAHHRDQALDLPDRCTLEVRGKAVADQLPDPGTTIASLARVRGHPRRPHLVVASAALLQTERPASGLHRLRAALADALMNGAGIDARRIRAAELAAALALGRRDLIPEERRDGWRRSGLAHLLAVSGLHVGLVGALTWLAVVALGLPPDRARVVVLVALPSYAVLAGASPSAVRAALMGMTYLLARALGRSLIPMAAVLLAATSLLLFDPSLVVDVGFQLTVLVTAALVRWVQPLGEWLRGPRWLSTTLAVPLVAQVAAAPIIAWHFRAAVPGALLANLAAPFLLAPTLAVSLGAVLAAPIWLDGATFLLQGASLCHGALWAAGAPGRAIGVMTPALPASAALALAGCGWLALRPARNARTAALAWVTLIAAGAGWILARPGPPAERVVLLPVSEGTAVLVATAGGALLSDGGRLPDEAARLLADAGVRRLAALIASHCDEDHVGGLLRVLETVAVERLVVPSWMLGDPAAARLLRRAALREAAVTPVARGSTLTLGQTRLDVLWPPANLEHTSPNDRSLVARLRLGSGKVLLMADVGRQVEALLCRIGPIASDVLVVAHHGSASSSSPLLLETSRPTIALIPAGQANAPHHPNPGVLQRLKDHGLTIRYPARDGWCGAEPGPDRWRAFP